MKSIKQVDDTALCLTRKRYGKGFQYFNEKGQKIKDKPTLRRLKTLVIPPMWKDVTICKWPDGHIQATGRDNKGRKQYIYHKTWERKRQQEKFDKLIFFGKQLPKIRKRCLQAIRKKGWKKNKVIALLVMILDETGIRIGNKQYVQRNNTYGLSTLRRKHLQVEDNELFFDYKGKSNQPREIKIEDELLIKHIKRSAEQPGYELFRYRENGQWSTVDSDEVNSFIQEIIGEDYSSKYFRTWVATRLAIEFYPDALRQQQHQTRRKFTNILIRLVADELGNTPTVCKNYYVHPKIMQLIDEQSLPDLSDFKDDKRPEGHSAAELLILSLLEPPDK